MAYPSEAILAQVLRWQAELRRLQKAIRRKNLLINRLRRQFSPWRPGVGEPAYVWNNIRPTQPPIKYFVGDDPGKGLLFRTKTNNNPSYFKHCSPLPGYPYRY